jgi:sporulation-control protein spo0M
MFAVCKSKFFRRDKMSFFKKIKQGLGIGTAKVELMDVETYFPKDAKEIKGTVILTAKSEQKVKSVKVSLMEKTTTTFGNETREQKREIQSVLVSEAFDLKSDESRKFPFTMPVDLGGKLSLNLFGGTLEISAGPKPVYEVIATADLEGVALDPSAGKYISFR